MGRQSEWIQSFEILGDLFNTGNNNGYTGPIETQSTLLTGSNYAFVLTPGFAGQPLPEHSRIWLDLNQNGDFESNELVYDQGVPSVGALTANLTVPMNAVSGLSRIRVQMAYQGYGSAALPNNCGSFQSGETEDYCVTIVASNVSLDAYDHVSINLYPNPSNGMVYLTTNSTEDIRIQVVSLSGQVVEQQEMTGSTISMDLTNLSDGVYMIYAMSNSGAIVQVQKLILTK